MLTIILRTITLYFLVVFSMRIMGKRQIGDMQPSDLVVTLLISEIAAIPIQDPSNPLLVAVISIFVLVALEIILSIVIMKSAFLNNLANGQSVIVIKNGQILQRQLKRLRVTVTDLIELLRAQGIFDISEVSFAVLESNGSLSVLQKPYYRPAKAGDVCKNAEKDTFPALVISDGKFMKRGLQDLSITKKEVQKILSSKDLKPKDVFIMILESNGDNTIIKKDDKY